MEAHLAGSHECQSLLRQAQAVGGFLVLASRQVAPPARPKQRILARIAQEEHGGGGVIRPVSWPVSAILTLSRFLFDRGNKVHEVCFVSLFTLSENLYLDKHHLVQHVY